MSYSNENRWYVYVFLDSTKPGEYIYGDLKFDHEPFYIGRGTGNRIITSKCIRNKTYKENRIRKIKRNGGKIISYKLVNDLSFNESNKIEIDYISLIGRKDLNKGPLTNLTDGGDGRINGKNNPESNIRGGLKNKEHACRRKELGLDKHTIETIQYLKEINTGEKNPFFGKKHTQEVRDKHSDLVIGEKHPMFNRKHSDEVIEKIKINRSKGIDQEKMNKLSSENNSKCVLQFDLEGNFIQEFSSVREASKILNISQGEVGSSCRGDRISKKFIFKYKYEKDLVMNNSYVYKIGDNININDIEYKLFLN